LLHERHHRRFPGEEASDFEETLSLVREASFDLSYSFCYSERPGTTASRLVDQLSEQEKKNRLEVLLNRQRQVSAENNAKTLNTVQEVLLERVSDASLPSDETAQWFGRTATNKIVHVQAPKKDLTGKIVPVRITETHPHSLKGDVLI
jgi:tRNA-2-methylthio-N6-dimethylallyladenosine synthase